MSRSTRRSPCCWPMARTPPRSTLRQVRTLLRQHWLEAQAAGRLRRAHSNRSAAATGAAPSIPASQRSGSSGRHRDGRDDRARSLARRHGGGNAPRRGRLRDGRGSRRISGRLQDHPGPACRNSAPAGDRYADHRARLCRSRRRRGARRAEAHRRVHDLQLRHAGDRPDHQLGSQDALHVRRPDGRAHRLSRHRTAQPPASVPSTARISPPGTPTFRA